ncbi:MAG TPA: hypothetical protein PLF22_13145 [Pseudomonadales bacterium]|nr:hypothetical protein [Pseudomonadales bacterium]
MSDQRGSEYLGKVVLAGLTYYDENGRMLEQKQIHGVIETVTGEGINLRLSNGSEFLLPPDPSFLQSAPLGEYLEHSSGVKIVNPTFITTWEFTRFIKNGEERWHAKYRPMKF